MINYAMYCFIVFWNVIFLSVRQIARRACMMYDRARARALSGFVHHEVPAYNSDSTLSFSSENCDKSISAGRFSLTSSAVDVGQPNIPWITLQMIYQRAKCPSS